MFRKFGSSTPAPSPTPSSSFKLPEVKQKTLQAAGAAKDLFVKRGSSSSSESSTSLPPLPQHKKTRKEVIDSIFKEIIIPQDTYERLTAMSLQLKNK